MECMYIVFNIVHCVFLHDFGLLHSTSWYIASAARNETMEEEGWFNVHELDVRFNWVLMGPTKSSVDPAC